MTFVPIGLRSVGSSSFRSERKKSVASTTDLPGAPEDLILNFSTVAPVWQSDKAFRMFPSEEEKSNDTSLSRRVLSTFSNV